MKTIGVVMAAAGCWIGCVAETEWNWEASSAGLGDIQNKTIEYEVTKEVPIDPFADTTRDDQMDVTEPDGSTVHAKGPMHTFRPGSHAFTVSIDDRHWSSTDVAFSIWYRTPAADEDSEPGEWQAVEFTKDELGQLGGHETYEFFQSMTVRPDMGDTKSFVAMRRDGTTVTMIHRYLCPIRPEHEVGVFPIPVTDPGSLADTWLYKLEIDIDPRDNIRFDPEPEQAGAEGEAEAEAPGTDNSCTWANDGVCDEPAYCAYGTDTSDCAL